MAQRIQHQNSFFCSKEANRCWCNTSILVVRPLLGLNRSQIASLTLAWGLPLCPDQSNQNTRLSRNRVRRQVLPTLRMFFNPQIDRAFYRFVEVTSAEEQHLSLLSKRVLNAFVENKQSRVTANTTLVNRLPLFLARGVMKAFLEGFACTGPFETGRPGCVATKHVKLCYINGLLETVESLARDNQSFKPKNHPFGWGTRRDLAPAKSNLGNLPGRPDQERLLFHCLPGRLKTRDNQPGWREGLPGLSDQLNNRDTKPGLLLLKKKALLRMAFLPKKSFLLSTPCQSIALTG